MDSIMVKKMDCCLICRRPAEEHHVIFGTANRKNSEKYGLKIPLCPYHHRINKGCPHKDRRTDLEYRRWAQRVFEEKFGEREDFIKIFGRNYL